MPVYSLLLINMYCLNVKHLPSELRTDKNKMNAIEDNYKKRTESTNYEIKLLKLHKSVYTGRLLLHLINYINWPYAEETPYLRCSQMKH